MREITYAEALVETLDELMEADERVHLMGGHFLGITPRRGMMAKIRDKYPSRVFYPPISEIGYVGVGIGAAMAGLRPIVDIATASFIFQAFSQVANEAANIHYMTGGQTSVPIIFHLNHGIRGGGAAQHSHSPQAMLWNTPGLEIMAPSTPRDLKGLLRTAARTDNPTIYVDHVRLFEITGSIPDEKYTIPFGQAEIKRAGSDVTVLATSFMVQRALGAAAELAKRGVDVEVIDPRTLVPLDKGAILKSVAKTGRLVIADECHKSSGVAAEFAAIVAEEGFGYLKAPIRRVTALDVPVPFSRPLEEYIEPTEARIVATALEVAG